MYYLSVLARIFIWRAPGPLLYVPLTRGPGGMYSVYKGDQSNLYIWQWYSRALRKTWIQAHPLGKQLSHCLLLVCLGLHSQGTGTLFTGSHSIVLHCSHGTVEPSFFQAKQVITWLVNPCLQYLLFLQLSNGASMQPCLCCTKIWPVTVFTPCPLNVWLQW